MTLTSIMWGVAIVTAAWALVRVGRKVARQNRFRGRLPIELDRQFESFGTGSLTTFVATFQALGRAFEIDPRVLRAEDSLRSLDELDSWDLGHANEVLNEWLADELHITQLKGTPTTIGELVTAVETSVTSKSTSTDER
jgi:hypothetical protein